MFRSSQITFLLLLLTLLTCSSCTGALYANALHHGKELTEEDIKAYDRAGSHVYGCITANGPPPAGATTWIIVPKDTFMGVYFVDGCHLK